MGLFGNKAEQQARIAAAQRESARLCALPVRELAAEVMVAFGPNGISAKSGHQQGPMEVVSWLMPNVPVGARGPILGPVVEALGVLEQALLVNRRSFGSSGAGSTYDATRLGETALSDGTVRQQLGLQISRSSD